MKLHIPAVASNALSITAYDAHWIEIDGRRLTQSLIVTPQRLIEHWSPQSFAALDEAAMETVAALDCPVVLLGTGSRQRFPSAAVLRPLWQRGVGVEVMDSFAACRTYTILMAEGRQVAAALIVGD